MERLVEDLLVYARAGRTDPSRGPVDTGALVRDVLFLLAVPEKFKVTVQPGMPVLETPRAPLEQVFTNLINNAIKHHDRDAGKIDVSARDAGSVVEFTVADDGPGIPPEFHDRLFQMFQTLRSRDQVEGSGIGLALIKRIVERHGGRVALESGTGRGAKFRFTWPKGTERHANHPGGR
jgi:signal transduction histidine kinase